MPHPLRYDTLKGQKNIIMVKTKTVYTCHDCGAQSLKWAGKCNDCGAWNSFVETTSVASAKHKGRLGGFAGLNESTVQTLANIPAEMTLRSSTLIGELDRVLGGGLVAGSVILIGGDPGIGKSTLLLQSSCLLSERDKVLYVTGEESLQQVSLRAKRLDLNASNLRLLAETHVEKIIELATKEAPQVLVIDSIQTIFSDEIPSAPGSVSQVRDSAAALVRFAKQSQTALFLVGHVTKEGALAGPRVLEHMVDTVLYFEGRSDSRYRMIRAVKNRFGAVNELGVFAMVDKGLKEVKNPSKLFLTRESDQTPGSLIMVTIEGSRPLLVEIQALVDESHMPNPRRVCVGLDQNRLAMLLAILSRHGGVSSYDQDVFVNVVGGLKIQETAVDLAVVLAIVSSLKNKIIDHETAVFGEIGLSGEIRPVQSGDIRIKEAIKHGFKRIFAPIANCPKHAPKNVEIIGLKSLQETLSYF